MLLCLSLVISVFANFKTWWQLSLLTSNFIFSRVVLVVDIKNKQNLKQKCFILRLFQGYGGSQGHRGEGAAEPQDGLVSCQVPKQGLTLGVWPQLSLHICLIHLYLLSGWLSLFYLYLFTDSPGHHFTFPLFKGPAWTETSLFVSFLSSSGRGSEQPC